MSKRATEERIRRARKQQRGHRIAWLRLQLDANRSQHRSRALVAITECVTRFDRNTLRSRARWSAGGRKLLTLKTRLGLENGRTPLGLENGRTPLGLKNGRGRALRQRRSERGWLRG
jgi:hypothetical protein